MCACVKREYTRVEGQALALAVPVRQLRHKPTALPDLQHGNLCPPPPPPSRELPSPVQYYNFIRFGLDGYRRIFDNLSDIHDFLKGRLVGWVGAGVPGARWEAMGVHHTAKQRVLRSGKELALASPPLSAGCHHEGGGFGHGLGAAMLPV